MSDIKTIDANTIRELSFLRAFVNSIYPTSVGGPWIAGGAVRRARDGQFSPMSVYDADIDYFFADQSQLDSFLTEVRAKGIEVVESVNHFSFGVMSTDSTPKPVAEDGLLRVQAIKTLMKPTAEELLDEFDFKHCMVALGGETVWFAPAPASSLPPAPLEVHKITRPVSTYLRVFKYMKQGYAPTENTIKKVLESLTYEGVLDEAGCRGPSSR